MKVRIARTFIMPDASNWVDMRLLDNQVATDVWSAVKTEGALNHPVFVIPEKSIHHIIVLNIDVPDDIASNMAQPIDKRNLQ